MQAFRLVFAVRAEKEALGRQKPSAVFLGQDIPNDNPGSPDPVGLSFPQQSELGVDEGVWSAPSPGFRHHTV